MLHIVRNRLRTRILFWSFIPTALILSAVALTNYVAYQRVTEDLVVGRNQQLAHLAAAQLSADLRPYVDTLTVLAQDPDIYAGTAAQRSQALDSASDRLLIFDGGAVILDPVGMVAAVYPYRANAVGDDWSNRSFFLAILHGGAATYSDVITGDDEDPNVLAIAVPILNYDGRSRGTLAGLFRVGSDSASAFYGGIVKLRLGQYGNTFLVDSAGRVIYHPEHALIGGDLHAQPDVQAVIKGEVGYLRTHDSRGAEILATFAPVPGTPWGLVTEENWDDLLAANRGYGQFLFLLLALGILLPIGVVLLGVGRITEPLRRLTVAAREIAGGKYGQQITIRTGDELEELGAQFNLMSTELQQSYSQLEERVGARTKDLATLNAMAAIASRSLHLQEILDAALDKTIEVLRMESGGAYYVEGATLLLMTQRNRSPEVRQLAGHRPLAGSVVEQAALAQKPLIWGIREFPDLRLKLALERDGIEQIICVPLMAKRKLVGAFTLGTIHARDFVPEELSLLAAIGQQIGVAVENAHLYQQAEETAAAAERTRLARELHDAVTQTLFSASLIAEVLPDIWERNEDEGRRRLEEMRQLTRGALAEMRTLLVELRPNALVQIPLPDLLRQLCESMIGRARLPIQTNVEGQRKLPPDVQVGLYRIAQEALNNVVKHSKATQAVVTLRLAETVRLSIVDDGCGFIVDDIGPDHLGLKIMRERAESFGARLSIYSEPGEGTQVTVMWRDVDMEGAVA